jgi:hypothetical protein
MTIALIFAIKIRGQQFVLPITPDTFLYFSVPKNVSTTTDELNMLHSGTPLYIPSTETG